MPVTPTPQTISLDLPEEFLSFLTKASQASSLSRQDVIREALAMLNDVKLSGAALLDEIPTGVHGQGSDLKKACLAAWDRWSESQGQRLPVSDRLAVFVDQLIADRTAKDPTGVVMLALLRYAKVMDLLPKEDE